MGKFNGTKSERQIGRILAFITPEAKTIKQIAAGLHMGETTARSLVRVLLAESPRRMRIEGWTGKTCQAPQYRAGTKPDAVFEYAKRRRKPHAITVQGERKRALILQLLAMPQTSPELAEKIGLGIEQTMSHLRRLRREKKVYVSAWILPVRTGSQAAVYALGDQPDKERTRRSRQYAKYARNQRPKNNAWAAALGV